MNVFIRAATAADQRAIVRLVRAAGINPLGLSWPRFVVAEECGRLVGIGQIKPHADGSRELASLVVVPAVQGRGLGGVIVRTLQRRGPAPLYLTCADRLEGYYRRFGFRTLEASEMPPSLQHLHRIVSTVMRLLRSRHALLVMRWDGGQETGDGRQETGDRRRETGDSAEHVAH